MGKYSKRDALCKIAAGLVATLVSPTILIASPNPYSYNAPTCRDDLYSIPTNHLLARSVYGEARGNSIEEKIAVGYTPFNRQKAKKSYYGIGSLKEILLHKQGERHQYDCFNDTSEDPHIIKNFQETLDPARYDPKTWRKCLAVANLLMKYQNFGNLNKGQTSYVIARIAKKLRSRNNKNWLKKSIALKFPYQFEHEFVREPTPEELEQILENQSLSDSNQSRCPTSLYELSKNPTPVRRLEKQFVLAA